TFVTQHIFLIMRHAADTSHPSPDVHVRPILRYRLRSRVWHPIPLGVVRAATNIARFAQARARTHRRGRSGLDRLGNDPRERTPSANAARVASENQAMI